MGDPLMHPTNPLTPRSPVSSQNSSDALTTPESNTRTQVVQKTSDAWQQANQGNPIEPKTLTEVAKNKLITILKAGTNNSKIKIRLKKTALKAIKNNLQLFQQELFDDPGQFIESPKRIREDTTRPIVAFFLHLWNRITGQTPDSTRAALKTFNQLLDLCKQDEELLCLLFTTNLSQGVCQSHFREKSFQKALVLKVIDKHLTDKKYDEAIRIAAYCSNSKENTANSLFTKTYNKIPEQDRVHIPATLEAITDTKDSSLGVPSSHLQKLSAHGHGNKYQGLVAFHDKILPLIHQTVGQDKEELILTPALSGLKHEEVENFLNHHFDISSKWKQLGTEFNQSSNEERATFLEKQDVITSLKDIQTEIMKAFAHENAKSSFATESLNQWLQSLPKNSYLMVRSDGIEDSSQVVNAGGNLSEAYIKPDIDNILPSAGRVIASYFGISSLKNQIQGEKNPFDTPLQLSVIFHELIGEPPLRQGTSENPADIPTSVVLLTDEPNYSGHYTNQQGDFRVTKINCVRGHCAALMEGAVNTESIYVVDSHAYRGKTVEVIHKQKQAKRLAPVMETSEQVSLKLVPNPTMQASDRILDARMIQRLKELSTQIEKVMGGPQDVEIVIKGKKIYIVQMRAVNRTPSIPTYLDFAAIFALKKSPISKQLNAKVICPGFSGVGNIKDSSEVLVCQTLKQAESQFKKGQHKMVIVTTDEPSNSHPVANFTEMNIPCFFNANRHEVDATVRNITGNSSLIACPQSGQICLWNSPDPVEPYIVQGYFSHPAPMDASGYGLEIPKTVETTELHSDVSQAIFLLKTAVNSERALEAIKDLQTVSPLNSLKDRIKRLDESGRNVKASKGMEEKRKTLLEIAAQVDAIFAEIEATHRAPTSQPLTKLFHIKHLSILLSNSVLNQIDSLESKMQQCQDYQKQLKTPAKFVDVLECGFSCASQNAQEKWKCFLMDLEALNITESEIIQFHAAIAQLKDMNILPMWLNAIVIPQLAQDPPIQTAVLFKNLIKDVTDNKAAFTLIRNQMDDMEKLEQLQEQLSDPKTIEKAIESYKLLANQYLSVKSLNNLNPLLQLFHLASMTKYCQLMDDALKTIKSSPVFTLEKKKEYMNQLLKPNYDVMKHWLSSLDPVTTPDLEPDKTEQNQKNTYIRAFDDFWKVSENLPVAETMESSPEFSVGAAVFGSLATFNRHSPKTLEDIFTLIHQNQLTTISRITNALLPDASLTKLELSPLIKEILEKLTPPVKTFLDTDLKRCGVDFSNGRTKLLYNKPMSNHSAAITLETNRFSNEVVMHLKFFGEDRNLRRWPVISNIVEAASRAGILTVNSLSPETTQQIEMSFVIKNTDDINNMHHIFSMICAVADRNRSTGSNVNKAMEALGGKKQAFQKAFFDVLHSPDPFKSEVSVDPLNPGGKNILEDYITTNETTVFTQLNAYGDSEDISELTDQFLHLKRLCMMTQNREIKNILKEKLRLFAEKGLSLEFVLDGIEIFSNANAYSLINKPTLTALLEKIKALNQEPPSSHSILEKAIRILPRMKNARLPKDHVDHKLMQEIHARFNIPNK